MINFVNNSEPDLSAENLNRMQQEIGIVVSPTKPTTNEKVWIQKGKNLFDKSKAISGGLETNGNVSSSTTNSTTDFIAVVPGETYYKGATSSSRFKFYNKDKTVYSSNYDLTAAYDPQAFTIPENVYYIRFSFANDLLDTLQIEQGTEATEYESYVEKAIHTKNDNGLYEEFVNVKDIYEKINGLHNPVRKYNEKTVNGVKFLIDQLKAGQLVSITITAQNVPANTNSGFFEVDYKPISETHAICQYLGATKGSAWITNWDNGTLWLNSTTGGTLQMDFMYFTKE